MICWLIDWLIDYTICWLICNQVELNPSIKDVVPLLFFVFFFSKNSIPKLPTFVFRYHRLHACLLLQADRICSHLIGFSVLDFLCHWNSQELEITLVIVPDQELLTLLDLFNDLVEYGALFLIGRQVLLLRGSGAVQEAHPRAAAAPAVDEVAELAVGAEYLESCRRVYGWCLDWVWMVFGLGMSGVRAGYGLVFGLGMGWCLVWVWVVFGLGMGGVRAGYGLVFFRGNVHSCLGFGSVLFVSFFSCG